MIEHLHCYRLNCDKCGSTICEITSSNNLSARQVMLRASKFKYSKIDNEILCNQCYRCSRAVLDGLYSKSK